MAESELLERMDALESRLLKLEVILGVGKPVDPPPPPLPPPLPTPKKVILDRILNALAAPSPKIFDLRENAIPSAPPIPVVPYPSQPTAQPIPQSGLEQTIGLKWAGWAGAVVLVIGAALGIKFGYDQGWFKFLSPSVRLSLCALGGLGLIAAGEWVYQRVNKISAAGLFGAGVAVLFVVSYSGFAYYDLYTRDAAFILMGISTIIGALVARRGNMVSIAALSLIGGNLAPALLAHGQYELSGFLVYLLMLQIVALTLAMWGGEPKWWTLRGLSLTTTSMWIASVMDYPAQNILIPFAVGFAGLYQIEVLISAARSRLNPPRGGTTFSLLVTAGITAVTLHWMRDAGEADRLFAVLGFAAFVGAVTLLCRQFAKKSAALGELSIGYTIQCLALLVVAGPIAFSGIWISAAWAVLAVALSVMGYVLDLKTSRYAGPFVWILAFGHLSLWTIAGFHNDRLVATTIAGIEFHQGTMMSWLLALLGQVVAKFLTIRRRDTASTNERQFGLALSMVSSGLWVVTSITGLPALAATASVLAYSLLLVLADFAESDLNFLAQATAITVLATAKWMFFDTLAHRWFDPPIVAPIFFSIGGLTSCALLMNLGLLHYRASASFQNNPFSRQIKQLTSVLVVAVIFWLGTFGIDQAFINLRTSTTMVFTDPDRAEQVALSIYWSVFALASIAAGFGWRVAGLRYFGLGLFALTLLKVVTIDLSQVSTGYRILSFLGLGILLLGTSVLYGKVSPMLLAEPEHESKGL